MGGPVLSADITYVSVYWYQHFYITNYIFKKDKQKKHPSSMVEVLMNILSARGHSAASLLAKLV